MISRRWAISASIGVLVLALVYFAVSLVVVNQALVAEAKPLEQHPDEFGLTFEEVTFSPRGWDDLTLRGWWFPNQGADAAIVRVHGLDSTRDVELEMDRDLLDQGFAVLTFDLRGHGESDKAQMGAGLHEQDDVLGAVDFLIDEKGVEPGRVLLLGHSYGAAIALLAGVREPAIGGVYADSAFASLSDLMVKEVADRTPIPMIGAALLRPGLILTFRVFKGIDITQVQPENVVGDYPYLIGLTHCRADERIVEENAKRLWRVAPPGSWFTLYPNCGHTEAYDDFTEQYITVVTNYFNERLGE